MDRDQRNRDLEIINISIDDYIGISVIDRIARYFY